MALWILKPTDAAAPSWHGNDPESVGSVMVEADSEEEARASAAASTLVDQKVHDYSVRPDERTTVSPWLDHGASSCEPAERSAPDAPVITVEPVEHTAEVEPIVPVESVVPVESGNVR